MDINETSKDGLAREYELKLTAQELDSKISSPRRSGENRKYAGLSSG